MVLLHRQLVANATAIAVVARRLPTHFTDAALVAVIDILLLKFVIVQGAYGAVIRAEVNVAALACCGFWLEKLASEAFDVRDGMPIYSMILLDVRHVLVHDLIMAEAASIACALADWVGAL